MNNGEKIIGGYLLWRPTEAAKRFGYNSRQCKCPFTLHTPERDFSEKWPKIAKKKPEKCPKFKKKRKSPKKAQNFKIAKKAPKSPNFLGSFSSGLFKTNFGIHGHFFY